MAVYDVTVRMTPATGTAFTSTVRYWADTQAAAEQQVMADQIDLYTERDGISYTAAVTRTQVQSNYQVYIGTFISTDGSGAQFTDIIIAAARNRGDALSLGQTEFADVFKGRTIVTYEVVEYIGPMLRLETRWGRGR